MSDALTTTWSPRPEEHWVHRRYLQVPKNEQRLLERADAWSAHSAALPRVPPEVLASLESASVQHATMSDSERPAKKRKTATPPVEAPQATPYHHPSKKKPVEISSPSKAPSQVDDEEDPGTPISWSLTQAPIDVESPKEAVSRPLSQYLGPPPPSSPSHHPTMQALSKAIYLELPSSSSVVSLDADDESPAETEVTEPPVVPEPARASALSIPGPEPTPPSAQIIPCTFMDTTSEAQPTATKRQRLMKSLAGMFSPEREQAPEVPPNAEISSNPPPLTISQFSMSSLPIVTQSATSPTVLQTTSAEGRRISGAAEQALLHTPADSYAKPQRSSVSDQLPPNGPRSQVPFTVFTIAYPDFQCSFNHFILGVKALRDIRDRRRLPAFLYDDLLRVFCGDYLDYIRQQDPDEKPLTLAQWYIENVSSPLYMDGILNRDILDDIIIGRPDVEEIRAAPKLTMTSIEPTARRDTLSNRHDSAGVWSRGSSKPRAPAGTSAFQATHAGELESDPIEIAEDMQPRRQPSPDLASTPARRSPNLHYRMLESAAGQDAVSASSRKQPRVEPDLPSNQQAKRQRPSEQETPVPETLLKPRDSNRQSFGPSSQPRKARRSWKEHLKRNMGGKIGPSSSAPTSSLGGTKRY